MNATACCLWSCPTSGMRTLAVSAEPCALPPLLSTPLLYCSQSGCITGKNLHDASIIRKTMVPIRLFFLSSITSNFFKYPYKEPHHPNLRCTTIFWFLYSRIIDYTLPLTLSHLFHKSVQHRDSKFYWLDLHGIFIEQLDRSSIG